MLLGLDCSHWNGLVDWHKAKAAGAQFAYFKASDGLLGDSMVEENLQTCILPHGCYHFFRPNQEAQPQIDNFTSKVPKLALPPVVDVEVGGAPQAAFRSRLGAFLSGLESFYGVTPIIYTRTSFWEPTLGHTGWAGEYGLWLARYGNAPGVLPTDWKDWTIWQFSADGNRRGAEFGMRSADVDLDYARDGFLPEAPDDGGDVELMDSVIAQLKHYRDKLTTGRPLA